jgi:molybdate transport system regulatory protein
MQKKNKPFSARSKIWLEDSEGNVVFGLGRIKILKAIKKHGSLNAASKALKMSYKAVWERINATEKRLGKKLLIKKSGGASGGGSELTPLAEMLIQKFAKITEYIEKETDEIFIIALGSDIYIDNNFK